MGEFGWAYISGSDSGGIQGSVQIKDGTAFTGSADLVFDTSKRLKVTGSVLVQGNISSSVEVSASAFYGDGSNISGITSVVIANDGNNRMLTANGDGTISAESNLTFDGSTATLTGNLTASVNVSASAFYGDGSQVTALNADNINAGTLNNARLPSAISVTAITSSTHVSASSFHGDGSALTGISSVVIANDSDNRVLTAGGSGTISAEPNLTFDGSAMNLTGTLNVSGAINANEINLNVTNKTVTNISMTGSTKFGDSSDDEHLFTGNIGIGATSPSEKLTIDTGNVQLTNGYQLQWGDANAAIFGSTSTDYIRIKTAGLDRFAVDSSGKIGVGTINPDHKLAVVGDISASVNISASAFYGDGTNLSGVTTSPGGETTQIQYNNAGAFTGSSNLTFDGSTMILSGTLNVSGAVNANEYNVNVTNKSITNLSATGSTKFGDTSDDVHQFTGSLKISGGVSLLNISSGTATTSSYLALDSSNNIVLTSSAGGSGGTIGAAEDAGGYGDGLFTDFNASTAIGTPIDRFNEVLKILAPTPAPVVSSITSSISSGIAAKLSFGSSKPVMHYTSSATTAGFSAVDATGIYSASVSGSNFRLGIYDGTQDITGEINHHVIESITNGRTAYSNDAFGNANEGTLKLELNGTVIHSVLLSGLVGAGNPNTGSANSLTDQSGFTNVSITASSFDGNNSEWYIFKHRTAKFKVDTNQQKVGWNYARVIHSLTSDNETNYIEWINDPSGAVNDLSISNPRIEDVSLVGSKYLSGVQYNTDATAKYKAVINNLYRNIYQASGNPISFTATNSSNPTSQEVEDLGVSEDNTKALSVTGNLDFNGTTLFDGTMTCNMTVAHPLKNTITNTGSANATGFLIETRNTASTNTIEYFNRENFRKTSGSYDTQASTTASAATWNSQTHMTGTNVDGHQDGLLFFNKRLYSPVDGDIPNGGDFGTMLNVESDQPDYVNDTPLGTRTFYRVLSNSSGANLFNFKIETTKNGTTFNNATLGASNAHLFVKIPGTTGWMDASQNFVYGNISDGNGALVGEATNDVDSGNNIHHITFGTASVANNDRIMLKVVADESWGGYIEQMQFTMPVDQGQQTPPVLSDIDNQLDGETVRVSFGGDNPIDGYTNTPGGNSDIEWADQGVGTNRRGALATSASFTGFLNEDEPATSDFPVRTFFNGFSGSLVLNINGTEVHQVSLTSSLAATASYNSNDSGFNLGPVLYSTSSNVPDYNKPYRTGSFQVGQHDQRAGYNYAKVIHRTSADQQTNIIEWVIDPSGAVDNTSVTNTAMTNFGQGAGATSVYYQSGVRYFAIQPTASYTCLASNFYSNVYQKGTAILFISETNANTSHLKIDGPGHAGVDSPIQQSDLPQLNNTADCETTVLEITGTVNYTGPDPQISGGLGLFSTPHSFTTQCRVKHPLKSNRTGLLKTANTFMRHSGTLGSTNENTQEYFQLEKYRIVSGNYATQAEATGSSNTWNSETIMNAGGTHDDGMVTSNGYLISPKQIGNAGDTRNIDDGGSLQAPHGSPNYSSLTNGTRTYYRYFDKNTAGSSGQIGITLYGSGSLVKKSLALTDGGGYFYLEAKVPGTTAWLDVGKDLGANTPLVDGSGAGTGYSAGNPPVTINTGGTSVTCDFNGAGISSGEKLILKISADEDWDGYLSRIAIGY